MPFTPPLLNNAPNSSLNVNRHYQLQFFDVLGDEKSGFNIQNVPQATITDSVNVTINYTIQISLSNVARFRFYNLSDRTIGLFTSKNNRRGFAFSAWYGSQNQQNKNVIIFKGLTALVNTYWQGADLITDVVACDIYNNLISQLSLARSYFAGTSYLFIVQDLLRVFGNTVLALDQNSISYLTGTYSSPKTFVGGLIPILASIAADANCYFGIQQNVISFIPSTLEATTTSNFLDVGEPNLIATISPQTGMVGYPRATSLSAQLSPINYFGGIDLNQNISTINVTTLMNHWRMFQLVQLNTLRYPKSNGKYYRIMQITHDGEWRGNNWYSNLILVEATKATNNANGGS